MNTCRQLGCNLLFHIVSQHGKDLLHKGIQLLLEEKRWVLGFHLFEAPSTPTVDGSLTPGGGRWGVAATGEEACKGALVAKQASAVGKGERCVKGGVCVGSV